MRRGFELVVDPEKQREQVPGIHGIIPHGRKFSAAFFVRPGKGVKPGEVITFHVEQWAGQRLIGGSSYELRARAEKTDKVPEEPKPSPAARSVKKTRKKR